MRISGFASGLDIDQIVKDLMRAQRVPLDKLNQKKTILEWQREQYRDVNIKLVDFRNNKLLNYGLGDSLSAKQVTISGNTTAVSAKANPNAVAGSMSIEVDKLATAAALRSEMGIGPVDPNQTLAALKTAGQITYTADGSGNVSFTINGATINVKETDTLTSVIGAINSNSAANVNAFLDSATGQLSIASKTTGAASNVVVSSNFLSSFNLANTTLRSSIGIGPVDPTQTLSALKASGQINYTPDVSGNITFTVNGASITLNETIDTLDSMAAAISSMANVDVYLDSITGELSITSQTGGVMASGDLLSNFNLSAGGTNAYVKINGIYTTRGSNTFTENGVEIKLNAPTGGTSTTLNVVTNTDKIVETIKSFIKDYNDVLDTVNGKINEERFRKFLPLSAEEKKEMKEDEIKLWEEKAKSGMLRRESSLSTMVSDMRLASMTSVTINGVQVNMASFGITTGKWQERGKLVIDDETKLRQAIEANPEQLMKFFTQPTTETDPKLKISPTNPDNGLFNRLSNTVMTALDAISRNAGTSKYSTDKTTPFSDSSVIADQLLTLKRQIDSTNNRLNIIETRYYKQFTAMETAMARFNGQSVSLFGASN